CREGRARCERRRHRPRCGAASVLCLLIGAVGAGLGLLGFLRSLGGVLVCCGGVLFRLAVVDEHRFGLRLGLTGGGSLGRCGLGRVLLIGDRKSVVEGTTWGGGWGRAGERGGV